MSWPLRFNDLPERSAFGHRIFKGSPSFHYGSDQSPATGRKHIAKAAGRVVLKSRTNTFGFYIAVVYDGDPMRHHLHQLQDRGRPDVGTRFQSGALLGYVGDPLLHLPWAQRASWLVWSGSDQSTGPHCHEECRTGVSISTAVDPRGPVASAAWARITAAQPALAGNSGTPLEDTMVTQAEITLIRKAVSEELPYKTLFQMTHKGRSVFDYLDTINLQIEPLPWKTLFNMILPGGGTVATLLPAIRRSIAENDAKDAARDATLLEAVRSLNGDKIINLDAILATAQEGAARAVEAANLPTHADLEANAAAIALSAQERSELDSLRSLVEALAERLRAEAESLDPKPAEG